MPNLPVAVGGRDLNHHDEGILRTPIHAVLSKIAKRTII
jgi:hypothetical protein